MLSRVLGLNESERAVLLHAALCKYQRDLRPVLVDCKAASAQEAYGMLAHVLGRDVAEVAACLKVGGRLEALGLIDTPIAEHAITDLGDLMRVSDKLLAVLTAEYTSESSMMAAFTRPAGPTALTLEDFPHVGDDARYLIALLRAAVGGGERGVNVLLYGPPGTGKTEFAKLIAQHSGCELYEVDCLDRDGNSLSGKERYRSLQVSQAFLKGRTGTRSCSTRSRTCSRRSAARRRPGFGHDRGCAARRSTARPGSTRRWSRTRCRRSGSPTRSTRSTRPTGAGSSSTSNSRTRRSGCARTSPASISPNSRVSEAFVAKVAARKQVTPAQIQSAARFARLTSRALGEATEALIERQLDRSDKALGHPTDPEYRVSPTRYDLDLLNVESRFPIPRIIAALKARPRATLCFYGMPGTGKTALAEHIARTLDKPLIVRQASDLMSKYVGETEQQMARCSPRRPARGDAAARRGRQFLQNRQMAVRNYEVTEVNEMLQGMERFEGIFICTTNLFDRIDEAALRRFSFKLRFLPLTQPNRERMFVAEVLGGDASRLTDEVRAALARLELLTPGDFAAVVRQYQLLADEASPAEFLEQLEREHRAKPDVRFSKPLGFLH